MLRALTNAMTTFRPPSNIFRGSMDEYRRDQLKLSHVHRVEVVGPLPSPNITSTPLHPNDILNFMRDAETNKVKEISFLAAELDERSGSAIGMTLPTNKSLETLEVNASQLGNEGMKDFLGYIAQNESLRTLFARSYNVECHYWSLPALQALRKVIETNKTLTKIMLPDNQLKEAEHINVLSEPYKNIHDRNLATISGFWLRNSELIPNFNRDNLDELDRSSHIRFRK